MDLDPDVGQYRFTAVVEGVEVNALRETLGVRPQALPIAGSVRGTLHCTGPLEEPVFSGAQFLHCSHQRLPESCRARDGLRELEKKASCCWATGTAIAVAPTPGMVALLEDTAASAALTEAGSVAVGAYDRVPFSSAAAVFTMDTASECFLLHAAQVRSHRCKRFCSWLWKCYLGHSSNDPW